MPRPKPKRDGCVSKPKPQRPAPRLKPKRVPTRNGPKRLKCWKDTRRYCDWLSSKRCANWLKCQRPIVSRARSSQSKWGKLGKRRAVMKPNRAPSDSIPPRAGELLAGPGPERALPRFRMATEPRKEWSRNKCPGTFCEELAPGLLCTKGTGHFSQRLDRRRRAKPSVASPKPQTANEVGSGVVIEPWPASWLSDCPRKSCEPMLTIANTLVWA
jgi:hypothetical protein